jgi:aryl-alcohol dehydrogenase (NADP+)
MQNHYNLVYREEEREMLPLCRAEGVGVIPWSPLARGFLAGNRTPDRSGATVRARSDAFAHEWYFQENDFAVLERVQTLAERRGLRPAQVALAWLLHQPGVTAPIIGASRMEHLEQAVAALEIALDPQELAFLEEPYRPHPVLGHE